MANQAGLNEVAYYSTLLYNFLTLSCILQRSGIHSKASPKLQGSFAYGKLKVQSLIDIPVHDNHSRHISPFLPLRDLWVSDVSMTSQTSDVKILNTSLARSYKKAAKTRTIH